MIDSGSQQDQPNDESGSHAEKQRRADVPSSVVGDPAATGKITFSTDPHVPPDDQTVVASNPPAAGAPVPPNVPTSGDLGKMLEGERLGHFHLEQFIGGGGMGAVFRGTDEMLGRTVAIKVLSPQQGGDEETTRRFRHEAQSTARLDHDHIARVYYVGVDRGWHYIVLEYVEGENLRDLVAFNGPLPFADVISYTLQISEALDHASGRDVVHRDIKPSNVLITRQKQAKLVDMGLARLHQVDNPEDDLTASGVTLGTFDYISPEQARDPRIADVRSDLYSLGCTVYFMLTGRPPFPQGTVLQKLLQHQGDAPPDPRRFRPDVPDAIRSVTSKLLAKNPAHRYQRPQELIHELLAVSHQLDLPVASSVVDEWLPQKPQQPTWVSRYLPWVIPVGVLTLVVLFSYLRDGLWAENYSLPPLDRNTTSNERDQLTATPGASASQPGKAGDTTTPPNQKESVAAEDGVTGDDDGSPKISVDEGSDNETPSTATPPGEEAGETTSASPPDVRNGPRAVIVGDSQDADYTSLTEACRQVGSSATIELRYNGRRAAPETPIVLDNKQLTIRGGEGYSPVVSFEPAREGGRRARQAMLQVSGGRLTLINVHVELNIPEAREVNQYALIEAVRSERIELRSCTLTIRDGRDDLREYDDRPSMLRVSTVSHQGLLTESRWDSLDDVTIELEDCIVRGNANFLTGNALGHVVLNWQNGLLAVDQRFVQMQATEDSGPNRGRLQVNLSHVTANARRGLCYMSGGDDARYFPVLKLDCVDSILVTSGAPLIEQRGWHRKSELQNVIRWSGHNNFYAGFDVFWLIDAEYGALTKQFSWNQWRQEWPRGTDRSHHGVSWERDVSATDSILRHRVFDYQLQSGDNAAIGGAADGMSNVGLQAVSLPKIPDEPTSDVE